MSAQALYILTFRQKSTSTTLSPADLLKRFLRARWLDIMYMMANTRVSRQGSARLESLIIQGEGAPGSEHESDEDLSAHGDNESDDGELAFEE